MHLPVQPLRLRRDLELDALLLCTRHQHSHSHRTEHQPGDDNSPRSLMLKTPETVLLVLRCLISFLSLGEAGTSEMAESTLLRSALVSCTPAAMVDSGVSDG